MRRHGLSPLLLCVASAWQLACAEERDADEAPPPPVYAGDVERLLQARCQGCHGEDRAEAGYRVDGYLSAIGCTEGRPDASVVAPRADRAPLLWSLRFDDVHAEVAPAETYAQLRAWVRAGAPLRAGGVHGAEIMTPGAPGFHGRLLADEGFAPLFDAGAPWACGRCHAGAPTTPEASDGAPFVPAPGASSCTDCHDRPQGVFACGTCHGAGARAHPPRDRCFFEDRGGAHATHVEKLGLACEVCHPGADASLSGSHANGVVDVRLRLPPTWDTQVDSEDDSEEDGAYDAETGRCAVYCHARGGREPEPAWFDGGPATCDACHGSPPQDHYAGACSDCHQEANADGTALTPGPLHLNGRVDVGDGEGEGCAACHGSGDSPWPDTPAHRAHRNSVLTEINCEACHQVPEAVEDEGHLDPLDALSPAEVALDDGLQRPGTDAPPDYADGTCSNVVCHAAGAGDNRGFRWDMPEDLGCTGCHGAPPALPHAQDTGCAQLTCHGGEVGFGQGTAAGAASISPAGRAIHMDGEVQAGRP